VPETAVPITPLCRRYRIPVFVLVLLFLLCFSLHAREYHQVAGLIDLRTSCSDGAYSVETIVSLARERGFRLLFLNDHDRMVLEYGLPPFRNLCKVRAELNSINRNGVRAYLDAIRAAEMKYPDMIIIPGSETASFYYWSGNPLIGTLTAHDHERRFLTIGMNEPEDYENLPIIHNGGYGAYGLPLFCLILLAGCAGALWIVRRHIDRRGWILLFLVLFLVLYLFDTIVFRSGPFDQYHGDRGMKPYQCAIDYVNDRGGMVFWNYPETRSGVRKLGPIHVNTQPYPEVLSETVNYTGFAAIYGDRITVTEPGNLWDHVLIAYCEGARKRPAWGIATADYHSEAGAGGKLGNYVTTFLVENDRPEDVLDAMRRGRMYAYRGKYPQSVRLDRFTVSALRGEKEAVSGETITMAEIPKIKIEMQSHDGSERPVEVRLIRSGSLVRTFRGSLPLRIDCTDRYYEPGRTVYYRLEMRGYGTLVSNPIFVTFAEKASVFRDDPGKIGNPEKEG